MTKKRKRQADQFRTVKGLIVLAFVLAAVILWAEAREAEPEQTRPTESTQGVQLILAEGDRLRRMTYSEMALGDLVLVNSDYGYDDSLVATQSLYDLADDSYQVADLEVALQSHVIGPLNDWMTDFYNATYNDDVMVVAGYRTVEYQQGLYMQAVENQGQEHADNYIALPGHSEHHTGLALDLDTYSGGIMRGFDGEGQYARLVEDAWEYGFVQRYPQDKSDITGISYESWHFRYVGIPHAGIMAERGLCLEEYITLLKSYPYNGAHLTVEQEGIEYEIYYCEGLDVAVPEGESYTLSGNNADGFIVTIEREKAQ